MQSPLIEAQIVVEVDGSCHRVRLQSVPRVGEIIHLTSHHNMSEKIHPYFFQFEVLRVEHEIHDFSEIEGVATAGHMIFVIVQARILQTS